MLESSFRRALLMSDNNYSTFVTDPIAGGMLAMALLFIAASIGRSWWVSRRENAAA
jgi:putative tricarboxylic transport membrane protein